MSEAEIADLKDRMAAGSRWLKAEIKGREKAEADLAAAYHKKPSEHNPAVCPVCREAEDDGSGAA